MKEMQEILDIFVERLKDVMISKNLNIKQLADEIKVERRTLNSWILKKRTPRIDYLYSIADCLGVSIDYLVGRED